LVSETFLVMGSNHLERELPLRPDADGQGPEKSVAPWELAKVDMVPREKVAAPSGQQAGLVLGAAS
jgi:hypothetical protein